MSGVGLRSRSGWHAHGGASSTLDAAPALALHDEADAAEFASGTVPLDSDGQPVSFKRAESSAASGRLPTYGGGMPCWGGRCRVSVAHVLPGEG